MQATMRGEVVKGLNHLEPHHIQQAVDTELTKAAAQATSNANQITTGVATSAEDFEGDVVVKRVKVPNAKKKSTIKSNRKKQRQNRKKKH